MNVDSKVNGRGMARKSNYKWTDQCAAAAQKTRRKLLELKSTLFCARPEVLMKM